MSNYELLVVNFPHNYCPYIVVVSAVILYWHFGQTIMIFMGPYPFFFFRSLVYLTFSHLPPVSKIFKMCKLYDYVKFFHKK